MAKNVQSDLELAAIWAAVAGDFAGSSILQQQVAHCQLGNRQFEGTGFTVAINVAQDAPRLPGFPGRAWIGDFSARLSGLEEEACFVLFLEDGLIDSLEGFTFDEPWPDVHEFQIVSPPLPRREPVIRSKRSVVS